MKTNLRLVLLAGFTAVAVALLALSHHGVWWLELSKGKSLSGFLGMLATVAAGYELCVLAFAGRVRLRRGAPSEVGMFAGLLRAAGVIVIGLLSLNSFGKLSGSWAAVAGFAGLLMGWSLQAPVSGLAAWVMVNLKRPFRVGDRVMLPAWGLIGDVTQMGMMYTVLNQVGGTVGSEEAAGRNVLIPNAMLFGNVVINFTPQHEAAFVLDEVIARITYDSDWDLAERVLLEAAREVTSDIIEQTRHEPYIRSDMYDYGVYLRLRYMTLATDRPRIVHEITKRVFHEFQKDPRVDFAIPYVYSYRLGLQGAARPAAASTAAEVVKLDVDQINDATLDGVAIDDGQVQSLANRIASVGLLQPIVVRQNRGGQYDVLAGHTRLMACKALGWTKIPAIVRPDGELT